MSARDSALELLAQGLSCSQTANTLGVTTSYISQLMDEEDFAAAVQKKRVEASQQDLAYDNRLAKTEEDFLGKLEEKLNFANFSQSLAAFRILNGAKRRKEVAQEIGGVSIGQVVNITLPTLVVPKYITNASSEIIEVEGQTMITATPAGLDDIVSLRKAAETQAVKDLSAATSLPARVILTGLERAKEVLNSVKPIARNTRKVPNYMNADLL